MIRKLFIISLLTFSVPVFAQSVSGRSNAVHLEVKPGKAHRTHFVYQNVKFGDADSSHSVEPDEQGHLHFTITNRSQADSQRIYVTTSLAEDFPGLQIPEVVQLHPLAGGKSYEVDIPLQATTDLVPGVATVTIEIREADVFEADVIQLNILTAGAISANGKRRR